MGVEITSVLLLAHHLGVLIFNENPHYTTVCEVSR